MLFNSYIFVLCFLPLCLAGYFIFNKLKQYRLALVFLLGMSLWFYGANTPKYLILILSSVLINFGFYKLSRLLTDDKKRKAAKALAVILNLGILFYFKYYDFFADTVNTVFGASWTLKHIMLPLGISFFTFQQLSFVIDSFNGEVEDCSLLDYACFVTFFPQLVAGPIVTHDELVPQLQDLTKKRFDFENFSRGVYIFSIGLAKKVLIADNLNSIVATGYALLSGNDASRLSSLDCLVTMLAYTLQMYFDFSGYSDMAIGLGKMFNIDLPQNFNSPYKAVTILDHWKRWHITLTRFLTKYIYIPLGGNRKGAARTYLNVMLVYLASGLWHGAGWNFVCWGAMHGLFCVITRMGKRVFDRIPKAINWFITFTFINLGFVFFRAASIEQAFAFIARLFDFDFSSISYSVYTSLQLTEVMMPLSKLPFIGRYIYAPGVMTALFLAFGMVMVLVPQNAYEKMLKLQPRVWPLLGCAVLLVWCIFSFGSVSAFLYFNF